MGAGPVTECHSLCLDMYIKMQGMKIKILYLIFFFTDLFLLIINPTRSAGAHRAPVLSVGF